MKTLLSSKILGAAYGAAVPGPVEKVELGVPVWIHLATEGFYKGHPSAPDGVLFDRSLFDRVVSNFRLNPSFRAGPDGVGIARTIPTDYEHVSEMNPTRGSIPNTGAPSPAWARDLKVIDGDDGRCQLWALTEITSELLRDQLNSKAYQWTSVAITRNAIDPVSGKEVGPVLTSFAFTNHPFIQGLTPIVMTTQTELEGAVSQTLSQLGYSVAQPRSDRMSGSDFMIRLAKTLKCRDTEESILMAADEAAKDAEKSSESGDAMAELMALFGADSTQGLIKKCMASIDMASKVAPLVQALSQINEQMSGAQVKEAEVECAAVVASSGFTDKAMVERLKKVIMSERMACFDETEVAGIRFRTINQAKLDAFRKENPITVVSQDKALLTQNVFAGSGGNQIRLTADANGHLSQSSQSNASDSDPRKIKLSAYSGRNEIEQACALLEAEEAGFKKLHRAEQVRRASAWLKSGK